MKHNFLLLIIWSCILLSCKSNENKSTGLSNNPVKIDLEAFKKDHGKNAQVLTNEAKTFAAVLLKTNENGFEYNTLFVLDYQTKTKSFIAPERIKKVEWINNRELKITIIQGVPTGDGTNNTYIHNTSTLKTSKL